MPESCDHTGAPLKHWRVRVNGIRMRQAVGGQVEPLLLVHGTGGTRARQAITNVRRV